MRDSGGCMKRGVGGGGGVEWICHRGRTSTQASNHRTVMILFKHSPSNKHPFIISALH